MIHMRADLLPLSFSGASGYIASSFRSTFGNARSSRIPSPGEWSGIPVRHTLPLYHNALNALFLDDVIAMFVARVWKSVDAEWAYPDRVYDCQPIIVPVGESLPWALEKETAD